MSFEPVKRETRSVKSHKTEPVHKLFNHYIGILKILINVKKGVNEIFRQLKESEPGLAHKPFTKEAISHLEKGGLIKQSKQIDIRHKRNSRRKHRRQQKKIMELTELGSELARLIKSIEQYIEHYSKLRFIINERFDISTDNKKEISGSEFRHKLEKKGWDSGDIKNYSTWLEEVFKLEYYSSLAIFGTLLARYALIIFKYNPEGIAREILNKLIVDTLRDYLIDNVKEFLSERLSTDNEARERTFNDIFYGLADRTVSYFLHFAPPEQLDNKFIQNESIELVQSLYSILSPPKGFLAKTMGRHTNTHPKVKQQLMFLEGLDKSP